MAHRLAIDLVPYTPGVGGSGGGIWTYAISLLEALDQEFSSNRHSSEWEVYCLTKADGKSLGHLSEITQVDIHRKVDSPLHRLLWTHVHLPRWCAQNSVDVLHKLSTEAPVYVPSALVTTVHDFMPEFYSSEGFDRKLSLSEQIAQFYFRLIGRWTLDKSTAILVPTNHIRSEAESYYGIDTNKITVTYEGVDCDVSIGSLDRETDRGPVLLCVAGFYRHKGHLDVVEAYDYLLESYEFDGEPPRLVLRGHVKDRDYYARVEKRIEESPFRDRIKIASYDPEISIGEIYSDASVLISLSRYEGFGLPLIEAQAHGVPVVASKIPTFEETVGESAILVSPSNPSETADKIQRLLSSEDCYQEYRQRGLENSEQFNWSDTATRTIESYKNSIINR